MTKHYPPVDYDYSTTEQPEIKHELTTVDMSDYTNERWFIELKKYLVDVMGMNEKQLKQEFDKRFPGLLVRDLF